MLRAPAYTRQLWGEIFGKHFEFEYVTQQPPHFREVDPGGQEPLPPTPFLVVLRAPLRNYKATSAAASCLTISHWSYRWLS